MYKYLLIKCLEISGGVMLFFYEIILFFPKIFSSLKDAWKSFFINCRECVVNVYFFGTFPL